VTETAVRIANISKLYRIGARRDQRTMRESLTELLTFRRKQQDDERRDLWALRDVSFDVRREEAIGIIGQNGAGKSTLLKILSRITEPTSGRIEVRGRVSSLLEVGTGFHAELTGRENISLNGAILGMTRAEIKQRFDEIVAFAEVERFVDTPVKYYSSGMYMRLAFAVAAHLEPEILVVDEVLAVGDAAFQAKCLRKMDDVASHGRTVLFVSHNMPAVRSLCQRAVWLKHGRVQAIGDSEAIVAAYLQDSTSPAERAEVDAMLAALPRDPVFRLTGIRILQYGKDTRSVFNGDPVEIELSFDMFEDARDFHIYFRLIDSEDVPILESIFQGDAESLPRTEAGRWTVTASIPPNLLGPGMLRMRVLAAMNEKHILPPTVIVAFEVLQSGVVNRAFPGYVTPGKVSPLFEWKSVRAD
jgi:lipopolysaccharide transport system ATP-binding protein